MPNRIIVPANFTIDVIIRFDPVRGQTDLLIKNRSKVQLSMWQVVGLLTEHTAQIVRNLLSGKSNLKTIPMDETPAVEVELEDKEKVQ